jgi:hypothetical protein
MAVVRTRFGAVAFLLVVIVMQGAQASTAFASGTPLPCESRSSSAVFSRWGDPSDYFAMPNGGFESGSTEWSLSAGAEVVGANEPYRIGAATDAFSLKIPAGASAESRTICVMLGEPTVRFFVYNPRVVGAVLHVEAIVRDRLTGLVVNTAFDVNAGIAPAGWAPTPPILIPNFVGGILAEDFTLRVTTRGTPATWAIDDIYVDPFKSY